MKRARMATESPPTIEQRQTIAMFADKLGIAPPKPPTATEARFVIDDLLSRERKQRRAAQ